MDSSSSVTPLPSLCERCQRIPFDDGKYGGFAARSESGSEYLKLDDDDGRVVLDVAFQLVDSWPDLEILSANADICGFCKLLRLKLKESSCRINLERGWIRVALTYHWRDTATDPAPGSAYALLGLKAHVFENALQDGSSGDLLTTLCFTIDAEEGPCKRWLRLQTKPPIGYLCDENISKITACLGNSESTRGTTFFPTRVLDLECQSEEGKASARWIRLVPKDEILETITECLPYVALSYCWGTPEQASTQSKTTNSNMKERTMSIDVQTLSMVIQDAVTVCRTFRIRYLWVDALCIIQGDVQDWERESSMMGDVFGNAYFTIGVASSESCHESFLSRSLPGIELPFISSVNPGVKGTYRLVSRDYEDCVIFNTIDFEDLRGSSWMNRSWVYQERILSRCLIVFGGNMVQTELEIENFRIYYKGYHRGLRHLERIRDRLQCISINFRQRQAPSFIWYSQTL